MKRRTWTPERIGKAGGRAALAALEAEMDRLETLHRKLGGRPCRSRP